jgi:hypothetical protein
MLLKEIVNSSSKLRERIIKNEKEYTNQQKFIDKLW